MRTLGLLALTACWTAVPVAHDPDPPRLTEAPFVRPRPTFPRTSEWAGSYRCYQGLSAVRLTIHARPDGEATLRYDFGPHPENPNQPSGAFEMRGRIRRHGAQGFVGSFEPVRWIDQPTNYFMVPLTVQTFRSRRVLRGVLDHETCGEFAVQRVR